MIVIAGNSLSSIKLITFIGEVSGVRLCNDISGFSL
jgi:hypothetical protein